MSESRVCEAGTVWGDSTSDDRVINIDGQVTLVVQEPFSGSSPAGTVVNYVQPIRLFFGLDRIPILGAALHALRLLIAADKQSCIIVNGGSLTGKLAAFLNGIAI